MRDKIWYIGLAGPLGTGKSTIATMLNERLNDVCLIQAFAKPLKDAAKQLGWDGEKDERGRKFLQTLGTECVRAYDEDTWVRLWKRDIDVITLALPGIKIVISDDVRFENEAQMIKDLDGFIVQVQGTNHRLALDDILRLPLWRLWHWVKTFWKKKHASEVPIPDEFVDTVLVNDGTLTELKNSIDILINKVKDHYHES